MEKLDNKIIEQWHLACTNGVILEDGTEEQCDGLDFIEGLNVNSFCLDELGQRYVLFEDGNTYTVREMMHEDDGDMEKDIIDYLEGCGIEFTKEGNECDINGFIDWSKE